MTEVLNDIKRENEQKKEYLNNYRKHCNKLKSLKEQLQSIREIESSAKIQKISDMPKGVGKQSDLSDYIVKYDWLLTKILKKTAECENCKIEIENKIADMPDGIESEILRKRYIEFKIWEQICVEVGYSWKQTHRLHGRALRSFKVD